MRLQAERAGEHRDRQHREVVVEHRPHREQEHEPPEHREIRVPRQRQQERAVRSCQQCEYGGDPEQQCAAAPANRHPQRETHGHDVERNGRREQPVRRTAEDLPYGPERVEAQRSGMTPAVGPERPDTTGEPDQRRVAAADVAHPDLGLGHVEQRVPVRAPQLDEGDDQREREHRRAVPTNSSSVIPRMRRPARVRSAERRSRSRREVAAPGSAGAGSTGSPTAGSTSSAGSTDPEVYEGTGFRTRHRPATAAVSVPAPDRDEPATDGATGPSRIRRADA